MAIRYKTKNNRTYAYETKNVWNKIEKKYQTTWTYLGVVTDMETKEYKKKKEKKLEAVEKPTEKLCLNYGDTFLIDTFLDKSGLKSLLSSILPKYSDDVFALICYKLIEHSAMQYADVWKSGNYARIAFNNADLSSQKISELLKKLGDESTQRRFFKQYLAKMCSKKGVIIDSTGLPNDIAFPLCALGHHGQSIEKETRLLMVVDKENSMPLYFRYMAGNIVDVSTLEATMAELLAMGVDVQYALIDAGYYSEKNIALLFEKKIPFLTRLPAGRTLFSELLEKGLPDLERYENFVSYGDRGLYIKEVPIVLFEKFGGFAYLCCDIKRKSDEVVKYLKGASEDKLSSDEIAEGLRRKGIFALISSEKIPIAEVLPLYYLRQSVEQIFEISKSYADILPLRVHSEQALRGVFFLNFLAVFTYINLRNHLNGKFTVEMALKEMRNLMCKVFDDNTVIVAEVNKKQKQILNCFNDMVGIF